MVRTSTVVDFKIAGNKCKYWSNKILNKFFNNKHKKQCSQNDRQSSGYLYSREIRQIPDNFLIIFEIFTFLIVR
jgi:hypothetical protein